MKRAGLALLAAAAALVGAGCGGAAHRSTTTTSRAAAKPVHRAVAKPVHRAATKPNPIPTVPAPRSRALRPARHTTAMSGTSNIAPGAPSDAEVARELARAMGYKGPVSRRMVEDRGILGPDGVVQAPPSAPYAVQAIVTAGNEVARLPYVYGGGHGTWVDSAYDCSGSVSFALANAGFLTTQEDSSQLARFGAPGPGRWVTIYANAGHAYMVVAGIRFDTSGRSGPRGSRWQAAMRTNAGFTVRHPPGL